MSDIDKHFTSLHDDPDAWKGGMKIEEICDSCLNEIWEDCRTCDVCSEWEQWAALSSGRCEFYIKRLSPK